MRSLFVLGEELSNRSNRILGWIFGIVGITVSICFLAYLGYKPGPSYDGHWTRWLPILRLAVLGLVALLASLISLQSRKWAAILTLALVVTILFLWASEPGDFHPVFGTTHLPPSLSDLWLFLPALLISGLFWLFTRRAQPTLLKPLHPVWTVAGIVVLLALVPLGSGLMSICLVGEDDWFRDLCGTPPPFTAQRDERQTVFTGRVLRSFRSRKLWTGFIAERGALVRIEKTFWGLPSWHQRFAIVLRPTMNDWDPFQDGPMYLIDADRLDGSLTRFLPIFRDHLCTRTAPFPDAEVQLRVLRDGPPSNGIRILGQTIRLHQKEDSNYYFSERVPRVWVTLETWNRTARFSALSDENGIYDFSGLPITDYDVGTADETGKMHWQKYCCSNRRAGQSICECTVYLP